MVICKSWSGKNNRRRNAASIKTNRHPNIFPLESVSPRFPSPYCLSIFTGFPSIFKNPRPKRRENSPWRITGFHYRLALSWNPFPRFVHRSNHRFLFLRPEWVSGTKKRMNSVSWDEQRIPFPHLLKGDVSTSICAMIISIRWIFSSMLWVSGLLERNRCHGNAENRANRCPPPSHAKPRHAPVNRTFLPNSCVISDDDSPRNSHRWNSSYVLE